MSLCGATHPRRGPQLPNVLVGEIPGDRETVRNLASSGYSDRNVHIDFNLLFSRSPEVPIVILYFSNTRLWMLDSFAA